MTFRSGALVALPLVLAACKGSEAFVGTPASIIVGPKTVSFGAIASSHQLTATVLDQRGDAIPSATVVWSSDNPSVADVSVSGLVTAHAIGSTKVRATITLTQASLVDSAVVTVNQVPVHFVKFAGDHQIDTVSGTLPTPVTVQVTDSNAHPIAAIVVSFAVTSGGGHVSRANDTTDVTGLAAVQWTIGSTAGPNGLSASPIIPMSGSPVSFTASGILAGSSPSVVMHSGDAQLGLVGAPLNFPPSVLVRNGVGAPIAGKQITFAVAGGGGGLTGANAVTDANGIATVGSWTVGSGANVLTATVVDTEPVLGSPVTFMATGDTQAYHIDVRFITTMTPSQQAAFTLAAAKWESVIFGDVPDVFVSLAANS
jgi:hypothetical protein